MPTYLTSLPAPVPPSSLSHTKTPMAQPPPPPSSSGAAGGEAPAFLLPVPTSDTNQPAAVTTRDADDHAPRGTPEEVRGIVEGLAAGSVGRSLALPVPRIAHDFRLSAKLERKIALGQSCWGERNWIGICGGEWSATWGKGKIVVCIP